MPRSRSRAEVLARLVIGSVRNRLAEKQVRASLAVRGAPLPGSLRVLVHFPDSPTNLYQLRQWYAPLAELNRDHPVAVLVRRPLTARAVLAECPVPVLLARSIAEVETTLAAHPVRAILYVNQNTRSFSVMRYRDPAHVFICHGESDKDYMASNQLKAYDVALIAGEAAARRLTRIVDYDVPGRTLRIGRPQVDVVPPGPDLPDDGRTVVLYAPTWEGDRPSMSYGSAASHGPALVRALLADPRYRVVVRPHPRTGLVQAEARAALTELRQLVRRANAADPSAQHLWDTGTPFGWHLAACDVCVTDISAVAYDWLATRKPLVVTEPVSAEAEVDRSGLIGTLDLLRAEDAGATASLVARLLSQGRDPALDAQAEHYYGDLTPGASMQRFLTAMAQVIERREAALARRDAAAPPAPTDDAPRSDETGTAPTPQGPDEP